MANQKDQKRKLLAIQKILFEKTDYSHPLTLSQIMEELAALNIDAERKSIYACIDALREAGMDIQTKNKPKTAYYLDNRPFSFEELAMLLNAVHSSPIILNDLQNRLTKRLYALASENQKKNLKTRIDVPEKKFRSSKRLYVNLANIQEAMRTKKQIYFRYFSIDISGKHAYHKVGYSDFNVIRRQQGETDGEHRRVFHHIKATPVRLVYMSGYYYLICWIAENEDDSSKGKFKTYRVDRIGEARILSDHPAVRNSLIANYDASVYEDASFGMFMGEKGKQTLTLSVNDPSAENLGYSWIMGAFYDKFGMDMTVTAQSEIEARVRVKTVASPQFFSWLLQFGGQVKIETPSSIALQYVEEYLKPALGQYSEKELKKKVSTGKRSAKKAN